MLGNARQSGFEIFLVIAFVAEPSEDWTQDPPSTGSSTHREFKTENVADSTASPDRLVSVLFSKHLLLLSLYNVVL